MLAKGSADLLLTVELLLGDVLHLGYVNFVKRARLQQVYGLFSIFNVNWLDVFLVKCFHRGVPVSFCTGRVLYE